ncbi:hypothetical protein KJ969_02255 [Patescibacteria group bacterium]|nr:hypothetical protein [Patescibacteria group bacterium]
MEIIYIAFLTIIASAIGTLTGFGTSTIMVPVLLLLFPWGLIIFIPASFLGAKIAQRVLKKIPQKKFRTVIAVFLLLVGIKLLLLP